MSTPYYDDGNGITIWHGDCRDILPGIAAASVDLVLTDPPFGIDFDYGVYDDDPTTYPQLMRDWIALASVLVGDGPFFVWQAMLNASKWHQWFPADFRIFAACKSFVQYRPQSIQHSWDPVIFWGKLRGQPSVYRKDFHVQMLAPFGANRPKIDHPCPRPLGQVQYVVELASLPNDIILDPFVGSGTTLVAAKSLGRRAIGIETEEKYCDLAMQRLRQTPVPTVFDMTERQEQEVLALW